MVKGADLKKRVIFFLLIGVLAGSKVFADDSVVKRAGDGIKKGGEAAAKGIKKGVDAVEPVIKKGAKAAVKGVKTGGKWVGHGLKKAGEKVEQVSKP